MFFYNKYVFLEFKNVFLSSLQELGSSPLKLKAGLALSGYKCIGCKGNPGPLDSVLVRR